MPAASRLSSIDENPAAEAAANSQPSQMEQILTMLQSSGGAIPAEILEKVNGARDELRAQQRALRDAEAEKAAAVAQAAHDDANRVVEANKRLWTNVQSDAKVKQLITIIEKTTKRAAKKLIGAAIEALDLHLRGVPVGDYQKTVVQVLMWLKPVHDHLADTNYFGKKAAKSLKTMLREKLHLVPEVEVYDVDDDDDDSLDIVMVPDDDDDGSEAADDAGLPPLPDRPQKGPNEFDTYPPPKVVQAFNVIMGIPKLRSAIRFELIPFLWRVHDNIVANLTDQSNPGEPYKLMLGGGKCQSRKTPLKLCMFIMGRLLGVSTLLLTTGTSGRDDLFFKFTDMLRGCDLPSPFEYFEPSEEFCYRKKVETDTLTSLLKLPAGQPRQAPLVLRHGTLGTERRKDWAVEQLLQGVCLVANNSCQAMLSARQLLETAKTRGASRMISRRRHPFQFLLIMDEADDFYRTEAGTSENDDGAIKMEKEMKRLRALGPLIKFDVSATLFAIYLTLVKINRAVNVPFDDIFYVEASSEYVGTELFLPPEDEYGNPIFLNENELNKKNLYINQKVEDLWEDAAKTEHETSRALVLDATTSSVRAAGNIYEKANALLALHPHAVAVVVSGGQIEWRTNRPVASNPVDGRRWGARLYKGKEKMFQVILEREIEVRYPKRPIFVFGYSQLMRGLSYRSSRRVPSHYVLLYGKSMSICRLVQAAGRAHGDQATVLRQNGFEHVTLLTKAHDFDTIKNYPSFLEAIKTRMAGGATLQQALQQQFEGKFNFSSREHGAKKTHLQELKQQLLTFRPTQPGELPGAEAATAEVIGFSAKRVIIEALRTVGDLDEDAMNTTEILTEIRAGRQDYAIFMGNDVMPDSAAEITAILGELLQPLVSCNLPALVECFLEGKRKYFYLNHNVLDALDFQSAVMPGTGALVPAVARAPTDGDDDPESEFVVDIVDDDAAEARHAMQIRPGMRRLVRNGGAPSSARRARGSRHSSDPDNPYEDDSTEDESGAGPSGVNG